MPNFIEHVALAAEERADHVATVALPVVHMCPPLERSGECLADCVGSAGLSARKQRQINVFCDIIESEYEAARLGSFREQYVICPHVDSIHRDDDTIVYRRFS